MSSPPHPPPTNHASLVAAALKTQPTQDPHVTKRAGRITNDWSIGKNNRGSGKSATPNNDESYNDDHTLSTISTIRDKDVHKKLIHLQEDQKELEANEYYNIVMEGVMKNETTMIKLAKDGIKRPWVWDNSVFQRTIQQTMEDTPIYTLSFSND